MGGEEDRFSKRYERKQEQKKRDEVVVGPDDAPIPDVEVEQVKSERTVGRNDPCPCNSGKKYKKCCGKPT